MKGKLYFGTFFGALALYGICCYELGKVNQFENFKFTRDWKIGVDKPEDGGDGVVLKILETCKDNKDIRIRYTLSPEVAKDLAKKLLNSAYGTNSSDIVGGDEDETKEDEA